MQSRPSLSVEPGAAWPAVEGTGADAARDAFADKTYPDGGHAYPPYSVSAGIVTGNRWADNISAAARFYGHYPHLRPRGEGFRLPFGPRGSLTSPRWPLHIRHTCCIRLVLPD